MEDKDKLTEEFNESQLTQWISEIERVQPPDKQAYDRRFVRLFEEMISQSPKKALQWLKEHEKEGMHLLPGFQDVIAVLPKYLLPDDDLHEVEEFLGLAGRWQMGLDSVVLNHVAKAYMNKGNYEKARDILNEILKKDRQNPEALHSLYDLAKKECRVEEAHELLNNWVDADPFPSRVAYAYKERLKLGSSVGQSVSIAVISSYVIDPLIPYLDLECRKAGLTPDFYLTPFNQYTQDVLNPSSPLYKFNPDVVFIALALEDLFPDISAFPSEEDLNKTGERIHAQVLTLVRKIREQCSGLIVLHDFVLLRQSPHGILDNRIPYGLVKWVEDLNRILREELFSMERVYLLPLNHVLGWIGKKHSSNPKMWYMASMRLSDAALPELARYWMRYLKPLKGLTKKCIVLDLDGTLWGGIVGELGPDGIHLGPTAPGIEYRDFQKALLNLTHRGVLLAICSKNNLEDVLPVIRDHKHMILREKHFSAMRINWKNKKDNLKEIAEELNIGIDSMVFIDDNPTERELIRQLLPEVLTVELPRDPSYYRLTLENLPDFELLAITREDESRVAQYQANQNRQSVRRTAASLEEYLFSLELKAEIALAGKEDLNRLVQLFNKTNQFNLTTRRYQMAEMDHFLSSKDCLVYTLRVSDAFGDHGLVGAAIVRKRELSRQIDSFLMSCRVMGLSVETTFLHKIYQDTLKAGITSLVGEFIPTQKNPPVENFYAQHGFSLTKKADDRQIWELNVQTGKIEKPVWIKTA